MHTNPTTETPPWLALMQASGRAGLWQRNLQGLRNLDDAELLQCCGFDGGSAEAAAPAPAAQQGANVSGAPDTQGAISALSAISAISAIGAPDAPGASGASGAPDAPDAPSQPGAPDPLQVLIEDRAGLAARLRLSIGRYGHHAARFSARRADGRVQRLELRGTVQRSADGRPEQLQGLLIDDSEAFALAHSSSELESQLALALDLGGISVWGRDLTTSRMHYSRQGWLRLGPAPRPEGLGIEEVRALMHPDDLPGVVASAEAALASRQPVDDEARYRHADGSWRPQLLRRVVQRDAEGRATAILGVALDVTERRQQRRRADDMTRRFETVTRAAGIGHWLREPGQPRAVWSDQLRVMFGLPAAEPVPTMGNWLRRSVHPDDRQALRHTMQAWLAGGQDSVECAFRTLLADGSVRQLVNHSQVEAGHNGPLLFGVVIDITERQRSERALKNAQERVALAVRAAGLATWVNRPGF
ncbi:MAG: PAS domain-containing protein [Rubrivivax sp.]|nr:PAS domain-containing protein [Rubrivivax sp.]